MKIKAKINKIHRINPNGVLCDKGSLDKLRSGESVDVTEEIANELLNMGVIEKAQNKKSKKGVK
jgi:hypothetical protein